MESQFTVENTREAMLERPLPNSAEAERVVLGSAFLSAETALQVASLFGVEDFYGRASRHVFGALRAVVERGDEVDPVIVGEELRRAGLLEQVGGLASVSGLSYGIPSFPNLSAYAKVLREKALSRRLVRIGDKITSDALEEEDPPEQTAALAQELLDGLTRADPAALARPATIAERRRELAARHELFFRGVSDAMPTGFPELDNRLTGGGLRPKQLVILAARPSVGKSALALDISANAAGQGRSALVFALEMGAEALVDRLVAFDSGVERWKIRPSMYESDYRRISDSLERVCRLPLAIDDTSRSITQIRRYARELSRRPETKPTLIVVDYLQLVEAEGSRGSRNDAVGSVSRALKGLAMELEVPVLALSQLSRDCEKQGREPMLSDLRDSGELEQDADVVLFLHGDRPEEGATFYQREVICPKQRDGALFRVELTFNGGLVSFRGPASLNDTRLPDVPFGDEVQFNLED